jgi:hypothetical protein
MAFLKTRIGTFYDKEILKYVTGIEATRNVVIDSTLVPVDSSSGRYILQAGQLLVNASGVSGTSEVDTITISNGATGQFGVIMPPPPGAAGGPQESVQIPLAGITAAEIQNALQNLPNVGGGDVTVTGTANTGPFTLTFGGQLAGQPIVASIDSSGVTAGTVTLARTTPGVLSTGTGKVGPAATSGVTANQIVGILTHTVEFYYPVEADVTDEPAAVYFHECVFDTSKLLSVSGNLSAVQTALPTCLFQ